MRDGKREGDETLMGKLMKLLRAKMQIGESTDAPELKRRITTRAQKSLSTVSSMNSKRPVSVDEEESNTDSGKIDENAETSSESYAPEETDETSDYEIYSSRVRERKQKRKRKWSDSSSKQKGKRSEDSWSTIKNSSEAKVCFSANELVESVLRFMIINMIFTLQEILQYCVVSAQLEAMEVPTKS